MEPQRIIVRCTAYLNVEDGFPKTEWKSRFEAVEQNYYEKTSKNNWEFTVGMNSNMNAFIAVNIPALTTGGMPVGFAATRTTDTGAFATKYNTEHILEMNTSADVLTYDEEGKAHNLIGDKIANKKLHEFLKSHAISGYDFDTTMVRMGAMNLMLHGVENPNLRYADTLSKQFSEKELYDVILANPPFKGSIDASDVNTRFNVKTKKTELLYVELIYDLLVTGGTAAVIVPDGVLCGARRCPQNSDGQMPPRWNRLHAERCGLLAQVDNYLRGAIMPGLNLGIIKEIKFFLPPLTLQRKFATLVEQVEKRGTIQRESEWELENLFQSLMQSYFG